MRFCSITDYSRYYHHLLCLFGFCFQWFNSHVMFNISFTSQPYTVIEIASKRYIYSFFSLSISRVLNSSNKLDLFFNDMSFQNISEQVDKIGFWIHVNGTSHRNSQKCNNFRFFYLNVYERRLILYFDVSEMLPQPPMCVNATCESICITNSRRYLFADGFSPSLSSSPSVSFLYSKGTQFKYTM